MTKESIKKIGFNVAYIFILWVLFGWVTTILLWLVVSVLLVLLFLFIALYHVYLVMVEEGLDISFLEFLKEVVYSILGFN